ncbi:MULTISPECIES: hypothetical protein [unclassified Dysgonomonas]|nr:MULTISPECIES: hypothetical protein [unclassified Dysgonomonas]
MKIRKLRGDESIPYDLLLLADPSLEMIDRIENGIQCKHMLVLTKELF